MNSDENLNIYENDLEKILNKFDIVFEKLYKRQRRILEKMRKRLNVIIFFGILLFVIWFVLGMIISTPKTLVAIGIIALIGFYCFYYNYESKYIEFYKKEFIGSLLTNLDPNLLYMRSKNDTAEVMQEYRLSKFIKILDNFEANEFIKSYVDKDIFMKMSGLHVRIGAGKKKHILRVNAVFSYVILNKFIKNETKISTKHRIIKNSFELPNEVFNQKFQVKATNKEFAIQLINNDIMKYLLDFYNETKINFELILKSDRAYIRFFRSGMFEPKILRRAIDKANIIKDIKMIFFVLNLGKKVNLALKEIEN